MKRTGGQQHWILVLRVADVAPDRVAPWSGEFLPETDVTRVRRWCRGRLPERVRVEVDVVIPICNWSQMR